MANESEKTVQDKLLDFYSAVVALKDMDGESEYPVQVNVREYRSKTSLLVALTLLDRAHDRPIPINHTDKTVYPTEAWIEAAKKHIEKALSSPSTVKAIEVRDDDLRSKLDAAKTFPEKRDVLLHEYDTVVRRLGNEAGLLCQILELQACMLHLSVVNAITIWCQAPDASDVRTSTAWGNIGASVKPGQQTIYMFRQNDRYKKGARYIDKVYDVSQTTCLERWITPTSQALEHVFALAKLGGMKIAHFKQGFGKNKVVENRPDENILIVNVSADQSQLVFMTAAVVAERLVANKKNIIPEERSLISILTAQLYAIRHGFGAYDRSVDDKVEAQFRARSAIEREGILEVARRMAFDISTRTEIALEAGLSAKKGDDNA